MSKIRKGDEVIVITGKDKGRRGRVLQVFPTKDRILVEGVNQVKKHLKPNPMHNQQGGIIQKSLPVHLSNVAIFNMQTGKRDRVGFKFLEDKKKVRIYKSSGEIIHAHR